MTSNAGRPVVVVYSNLMSTGGYVLTMPMGCMGDHPEFRPFYSPKTMLEMGVFEGKYLNSCQEEYPADWFKCAKLSATPNPAINFFGVKSRLSTSWWKERKLIDPQDPRGWFEWYCRFFSGRRTEDDVRQITRHRQFARHSAQVRLWGKQAVEVRAKQRQALLQWSWDPKPDF